MAICTCNGLPPSLAGSRDHFWTWTPGCVLLGRTRALGARTRDPGEPRRPPWTQSRLRWPATCVVSWLLCKAWGGGLTSPGSTNTSGLRGCIAPRMVFARCAWRYFPLVFAACITFTIPLLLVWRLCPQEGVCPLTPIRWWLCTLQMPRRGVLRRKRANLIVAVSR